MFLISVFYCIFKFVSIIVKKKFGSRSVREKMGNKGVKVSERLVNRVYFFR